MINIAKKLVICSMVGVMQLGIVASITEASPKQDYLPATQQHAVVAKAAEKPDAKTPAKVAAKKVPVKAPAVSTKGDQKVSLR